MASFPTPINVGLGIRKLEGVREVAWMSNSIISRRDPDNATTLRIRREEDLRVARGAPTDYGWRSRVWHGISAISRTDDIIIRRDEGEEANGERHYREIARILEWTGATTNFARFLMAWFDPRWNSNLYVRAGSNPIQVQTAPAREIHRRLKISQGFNGIKEFNRLRSSKVFESRKPLSF